MIQDTEGISIPSKSRLPHWYEAVAQRLAAFRCNEWVIDIGVRFGVVKVSVAVGVQNGPERLDRREKLALGLLGEQLSS